MLFRVVPERDEEFTMVVVDREGDDDAEEDSLSITQLMIDRYASHIKSPIPTSSITTHTIITQSTRPPQIIEIDNLQRAELYEIQYQGKYFVFLMSLPHSIPNKTDSHIGYTTNPITNVYLHNGRFIIDRNTSQAAPNWELDIVMGPFVCRMAAYNCANAWVNGTRGKESKRAKAEFLSGVYNVNIYTCLLYTSDAADEL